VPKKACVLQENLKQEKGPENSPALSDANLMPTRQNRALFKADTA
jgi:hypothetical protein